MMFHAALSRTTVSTILALPLIALGLQSVSAQGGDLQFEIINNTSRAIVDFRVDPSSAKDWGENILTRDVGPGETLTVSIEDGLTTCIYDTYTQWSDGAEAIEERVNMCKSPSWSYED